MKRIFSDLPQAITNIEEVIEKVEPFDLAREVLLPKFDIPDSFSADASNDSKDKENYKTIYSEEKYKQKVTKILNKL